MYSIRIERQGFSHWFKAESRIDAMELFEVLTKISLSAQVWQGLELVADNNIR